MLILILHVMHFSLLSAVTQHPNHVIGRTRQGFVNVIRFVKCTVPNML